MTLSRTEKRTAIYLKKVGLKVREIREAKGMTLEDVEAAGYPSWRHLQKVESGHPMTVKTLCNLALALGVQPSRFLDEINI